MKLRILLGLTICIVAGAASCPEKRVSRESCVKACTNLASLLVKEKTRLSLEPPPGLDTANAKGKANLDECVDSCMREANEAHLDCLGQAQSIPAWMECDDGSNSWF